MQIKYVLARDKWSTVPQGTVLRPLLFLILMSDIDIGVLNAKVVSFADDII